MDIPQIPFQCLRLVGQEVFVTKTLFLIINISLVMFGFIFSTLEPVLHYEGLESIAGGMEVSSIAFQWLVKCCSFYVYRKSIQRLTLNLNNFWPLRSCGKQLEDDMRKIHKTVFVVFKIYVLIMWATTGFMLLKSLLTIKTTKALPMTLYHIVDFKSSPFYELSYVWFICFAFSIIMFYSGFDGLFLVFVTCARTQLIMLNYKLRHLKIDTLKDERACMKLVKKYVEHHVFILKFLRELKSIFSNLLLIQFMSSTVEICMSIYMVNEKGLSDVVFTIRCCFVVMACSFQLMIYCVAGTQVKTDMENVADAMFESDWWKKDMPQLRRATILIIQRSQRIHSFRAGGMVDLDLKTFISILRLSFSFFTLMSSKKE